MDFNLDVIVRMTKVNHGYFTRSKRQRMAINPIMTPQIERERIYNKIKKIKFTPTFKLGANNYCEELQALGYEMDGKCAICFDSLINGRINYNMGSTLHEKINAFKTSNEPVVKFYLTACGHVFHNSCILEWVKHNKICPIDRYKLMTSS
ncbi:MAG: RING finger domain-containing protein [Janthinobacterium lividum]